MGKVGKVRLVVECGAKDDSLGSVVSEEKFRSVRGARDSLADLREEWESQGWEQEDGSAVWWREEWWIQGLVVDERGEVV